MAQKRTDNPSKAVLATRAYRERNREKVNADARAAQKKWREENPELHRARAKKWKVANPEKFKANHLKFRQANRDRINAQQRRSYTKRVYGLTVEERHAMLEAQGGHCAICGTDVAGAKGWNVDHCHTSLKVRGILCTPCNQGIGFFKDDPDRLRAAAAYLEKCK